MAILRLIQGLASAGALVISRAVSTDLYRGREMAEFFALLMAVNGLAQFYHRLSVACCYNLLTGVGFLLP